MLVLGKLAAHSNNVCAILRSRVICYTGSTKNYRNKSNVSQNHYDIIIGGGGLIGTTLATALAGQQVLSSKSILLLEGGPVFKGFNPSGEYGNRVSAINNNSIELFKTIGIWEDMENARVKHIKQMQVWDAGSDALIQFQHEHFADDVACIIENDLILHSVYNYLKQNAPNVKIRNNSRIKSIRLPSKTGNNLSELILESGEKYSCELLIGADGANSLVRKEMGVDTFTVNYDRFGIVATVQHEENGENCVAWQRFIPTGPVALLPLTTKLSSIVWSTTIPHSEQLLAMKDNEFVNALNQAFVKDYKKSDIAMKAVNFLNGAMGYSGQQLRQYPPKIEGIIENSRAKFPLGFLHASSYVCSGAALIGDAAHRIHPLAGQGVNLGFSDIRHLVRILADGVYAGAKLGDKQYLIKYERNCLTKNVPIMIATHGIQRIYSTDFSPIVLLRSLGLQLTHNIPPIKNFFMKRAMS